MDSRKFFATVLNANKTNVGNAIDVIYNVFDDLLIAREYDICNEILDQADPSALGIQLTLALLSISNRRSHIQHHRQGFVEKARAYIEQEDPERAHRLLEGLI
jgi:hypothetical protein